MSETLSTGRLRPGTFVKGAPAAARRLAIIDLEAGISRSEVTGRTVVRTADHTLSSCRGSTRRPPDGDALEPGRHCMRRATGSWICSAACGDVRGRALTSVAAARARARPVRDQTALLRVASGGCRCPRSMRCRRAIPTSTRRGAFLATTAFTGPLSIFPRDPRSCHRATACTWWRLSSQWSGSLDRGRPGGATSARLIEECRARCGLGGGAPRPDVPGVLLSGGADPGALTAFAPSCRLSCDVLDRVRVVVR
jgi:hypothetical protein